MSPDSLIHVSHDRAGTPVDVAELRAMTNVEMQLHQGGYGDYSHVDRYLAAVDWIRAEGLHVDWLVNLTGQDYPLQPLAACEAELADSGVDGFMEHWPALGRIATGARSAPAPAISSGTAG